MADELTPAVVAAVAPAPVAPAPVAPAPVVPEEPAPPDPLALQVASAVQRLRREAGLSERAAARRLGTSQTQLRRMEDPRYLPSLRSLARVAAAYGRTVVVEFAPLAPERKRPAPAPKAKPAARPSAPAKAARPGRTGPARKGRGARGAAARP